MAYLKLLYAIFMGALMTVATRFGPSLTIFAFVYLSRFSSDQHYDQVKTLDQWLLYLLPATSIVVGYLAHFMRVIIKKYSSHLDLAVLPFVDYLILRYIERGNLLIVSLRNQSVHALRVAQSFLLLLIISGVIAFVSSALSILSLLLLIVVVAMALWRIYRGISSKTIVAMSSRLEGSIEQVMITMMIVGCMFFVPRSQWLQVAIGLFVLVRFTISYRTLGKSILMWAVVRKMRPWHPEISPIQKLPQQKLRTLKRNRKVSAVPSPKLD